jgi:diadenosine tetraphosphatase ApaH/serine/threonine PP2A family protein phosphatase
VRILLLSDIHSNLEALQACLAAAPAHDAAVSLGDVVGYGGNPNEVVERVRSICALHVRGNHDKACTGLTTLDGFNPVAAVAASWTRQALTDENHRWLRALPSGPLSLKTLEGVQFVHGSPLDEDEYLITLQDALEVLLRQSAPVTFFGHTHIQGGFWLYKDRSSEIHPLIEAGNKLAFSELPVERTARYLINPGSVGQPRDGDWRAAFALYDPSLPAVRFYRVPYEIKRAQERIRNAHLPEHLAMRLSVGR